MLNFLAKVWNIYYKFINTYCTKEYQLKLESYVYSQTKNTYFLTFRVRTKPITQELDISQLFFDNELLDLIHPSDSYVVGIIYGMYRNQVKIHHNHVIDYFQEYDSYHMVEPSLLITTQYMDEDTDFVTLQTRKGNQFFRVAISELCKKSFLLHAIGSRESCKLGFFISEKFIVSVD